KLVEDLSELSHGEQGLAEVEVKDVVLTRRTSEERGSASEPLPHRMRDARVQVAVEPVPERPARDDDDVALITELALAARKPVRVSADVGGSVKDLRSARHHSGLCRAPPLSSPHV